jgi:hypothetical protein
MFFQVKIQKRDPPALQSQDDTEK